MNWKSRKVNAEIGYGNYRVINLADGYCIQEVYYDKDGKPAGYCNAHLEGETLEELREVFSLMGLALCKPVLKPEDFIGESDDTHLG